MKEQQSIWFPSREIPIQVIPPPADTSLKGNMTMTQTEMLFELVKELGARVAALSEEVKKTNIIGVEVKKSVDIIGEQLTSLKNDHTSLREDHEELKGQHQSISSEIGSVRRAWKWIVAFAVFLVSNALGWIEFIFGSKSH